MYSQSVLHLISHSRTKGELDRSRTAKRPVGGSKRLLHCTHSQHTGPLKALSPPLNPAHKTTSLSLSSIASTYRISIRISTHDQLNRVTLQRSHLRRLPVIFPLHCNGASRSWKRRSRLRRRDLRNGECARSKSRRDKGRAEHGWALLSVRAFRALGLSIAGCGEATERRESVALPRVLACSIEVCSCVEVVGGRMSCCACAAQATKAWVSWSPQAAQACLCVWGRRLERQRRPSLTKA